MRGWQKCQGAGPPDQSLRSRDRSEVRGQRSEEGPHRLGFGKGSVSSGWGAGSTLRPEVHGAGRGTASPESPSPPDCSPEPGGAHLTLGSGCQPHSPRLGPTSGGEARPLPPAPPLRDPVAGVACPHTPALGLCLGHSHAPSHRGPSVTVAQTTSRLPFPAQSAGSLPAQRAKLGHPGGPSQDPPDPRPALLSEVLTGQAGPLCRDGPPTPAPALTCRGRCTGSC